MRESICALRIASSTRGLCPQMEQGLRPNLVTSAVMLGDKQSFKVVWSGDECFALVLGLSASFGMSASGFRGHLSKIKVATVKNEDLKRSMGLTGKMRFLNRDGMSSLLDNRVKDEAILASAKQMLVSPPLTVAAPERVETKPVVPQAAFGAPNVVNGVGGADGARETRPFPLLPGRPLPPLPGLILRTQLETEVEKSNSTSAASAASAASDVSAAIPPPLPPRPAPVDHQVDEEAIPLGPVGASVLVMQHLTLPNGDAWYHDDDYSVGKSYALPPFDRGDLLIDQLRLFREFWTAERMLSRHADPLSMVTLDKRESRVLLYLGFLRIIKAIEDPKRLTLNACLNHHAVHAFIDWLGKGRDSSAGNVVEYVCFLCGKSDLELQVPQCLCFCRQVFVP